MDYQNLKHGFKYRSGKGPEEEIPWRYPWRSNEDQKKDIEQYNTTTKKTTSRRSKHRKPVRTNDITLLNRLSKK